MSSKIWVTSDTHYHHKNIVRGTSEWEFDPKSNAGVQRLRDFNTLEEHDFQLVKNINELVKEDDILYHLGDWSFGGIEQVYNFRKQLNCKNIHLIYGNHDHHIENNRLLPNHNHNQRAQGLFLSCDYYSELSIAGKRIILSHYAMRVWNKSHHGAIHLYGHSHGSLPSLGKSMDVGVDTNNLFPYSLEDIFEKMSKIEVEILDHHNKNTN